MASASDGTGPCAASRTTPCLRMNASAWREVSGMSLLQQGLQRGERAFPAEPDHLVVSTPADVLFETGLRDAHARRRGSLGLQRHVQRHRPDRVAVGRKPERVGDKEPTTGMTLDDRPSKDAAQTAEDVIAEVGRRPLDHVRAERAGYR